MKETMSQTQRQKEEKEEGGREGGEDGEEGRKVDLGTHIVLRERKVWPV